MGHELQLVAVHPGVSVDHVREQTGWQLKVADHIDEITPPTADELALLRDVVDPHRIYLR